MAVEVEICRMVVKVSVVEVWRVVEEGDEEEVVKEEEEKSKRDGRGKCHVRWCERDSPVFSHFPGEAEGGTKLFQRPPRPGPC